jgi:hypothetical protein
MVLQQLISFYIWPFNRLDTSPFEVKAESSTARVKVSLFNFVILSAYRAFTASDIRI